MFGIRMEYAWKLRRIYTNTFGICMEYAWHMLGICIECAWNMYEYA